MTTGRTGGPSRAPSARPGSMARDILKRRAKPYKTEQSRMLAKKKKMQIQTTFTTAPDGFTFLPLGTPDLSDRCKEVSRQRGLPILVVNAKPLSKQAQDPAKVSHHIHRIGYHFRSDVVEEACQELGYTYSRGQFLKEADLASMNERSKMARAMAKYGFQPDSLTEPETDDQVRAAIKELFPKIPEKDLKEILRHAWEAGSNRVGTVAGMDLPRRVQLAVIARIRHAYTDYDYLLKAFDWQTARSDVEPACLQKLIEWRGENDEGEDGELEEVIRETIVIDDDDDNEVINIDDDEPETITIDDDSEPGQRTGYNSDTSVEISHRVAADEDLGAESHDERSKMFIERYNLRPRNIHQRDIDLRQKIGAARERMRNERLPPAQQEIVRVHVPESSNGIIEIGGQQYRRVPSATPVLPPSPHHFVQLPPSPHAAPYAGQAYPWLADPAHNHSPHERPVASIEPQDDLRRAAMASASMQKNPNKTHSRPDTPESEASEKRRRLHYGQGPPAQSGHLPHEVPRQLASSVQSPYQYQDTPRGDARQGPPSTNGSPATARGASSTASPYFTSSTASYDPHKPLLRPEDYREHRRGSMSERHSRPEQSYRPGFVDAQVAPIQYAPHPQLRQEPPVRSPHLASGVYHTPGYPQPQVIYVQTPQTPLPVHGAPAAVQQVPRQAPPAPFGAAGVYQQSPALPSPQPLPYHGQPAQPPQFYYPR